MLNCFSLDFYENLDQSCQNAIKTVIKENYSFDELRSYIESNLELNEGQRKLVFKFWKIHGAEIMRMIKAPVANQTQGIEKINWEISMTK